MARIDAAACGESGAVPAAARPNVLRHALIIGGVVATALSATYAYRGAPHGSAPERPSSTTSVEAPAASAVGIPNGPSSPVIAVEDLPPAPAPVPPPSRAASPSSSSDGKDSFREQLAVVESARHSLSSGKADECLATLQGYDQKFPSGVFATEVRMVRIEALRAAGRDDEALVLARGLLASEPRGPYADRLRTLFPQLDGIDR